MRTLTRRLAPHARTAWLTFAAVALVVGVVAVSTALLASGAREVVGITVFGWFVLTVASAACLDAVLVPGNPDMRQPTPGAGWSGAALGGGHGGGHLGGHGSGHGGSHGGFDGGGCSG